MLYPEIFVSGIEYSANVSKWVKHVHHSMDVTQWCARAKADSAGRMRHAIPMSETVCPDVFTFRSTGLKDRLASCVVPTILT
jgi:hypothetical protein